MVEGDEKEPLVKRATFVIVTSIIAGLIVTVVGGIILNGMLSRGATGDQSKGESAPSQSAAESRVTSAPPAAPAPAPAAAVFAPITMTTSDAVDDTRCAIPGWTGYPWEDGSPAIGGAPHQGGFTCDVAYASAKGSLEFLVPAGATQFTAVAGQADAALNTTLTMRFEVLNTLTGVVLTSADLGYGRSLPVNVPVAGMTRLTVRVSMLSAGTPPKDKLGTAAWADPTFK